MKQCTCYDDDIWCAPLFLPTVSGPVEADPEYRLIVAANNLTVEIDNDLSELLFIYLFILFYYLW